MERLLSRSEPSHRSAAAVSYPRKEAATGTFRYLEDSTLKKNTKKTPKKAWQHCSAHPSRVSGEGFVPAAPLSRGRGLHAGIGRSQGLTTYPCPLPPFFFPTPLSLCRASATPQLAFFSISHLTSALPCISTLLGDSGGGVLLFLHLPTHGARPLPAGSIWQSNNQALGGQSPITLGHQN